MQFTRAEFDPEAGERKTLVHGPPGSTPSTAGGQTAPGCHEPGVSDAFEFLDSEYRRGTPCASAFKSEAKQRIFKPAPGGYGPPPPLSNRPPHHVCCPTLRGRH